jgi:2'-hydroxyisoflavone reductase
LRSIRFSHFQCSWVYTIYTRGDALRACPWLSYLCAFGAGTVWFRTFEAKPTAFKAMKILVIGGTRFVGRHLVTAALANDHEVTLFNRGQHQASDLPRVETIHGDRNHDLAKLETRHWDAVVDTCGTLPRTVRASAEQLASSIGVYVFISSISVYADLSALGVKEDAPLKTLTSEQIERANSMDPTSPAGYGELYGGLKALCEHAAEEVIPGRVLNIRPGLIVGPYDYTDRFTYWVARVARGGEILAPGRPDRYVQFIDARDLAEWIVRMIEQKKTDVFNANGFSGSVTMESFLSECKVAAKSDAAFTWVEEGFLLEEDVAAWSEMPLWLPGEEVAPTLKGFMFVNSDKAVSDGLRFRPVCDTIESTLAWYRSNQTNTELQAGIDLDREKTLLHKWHQQQP